MKVTALWRNESGASALEFALTDLIAAMHRSLRSPHRVRRRAAGADVGDIRRPTAVRSGTALRQTT